MFKSKYLLKPLVSIVVLQMILMPVAPVLAEEIQSLNNFIVESGTSTEVAAMNIVDPVVPPVENIILLNAENIPLPSALFTDLLPTDIIFSLTTSTATSSIEIGDVSNIIETTTSTVIEAQNIVTSSAIIDANIIEIATTTVAVDLPIQELHQEASVTSTNFRTKLDGLRDKFDVINPYADAVYIDNDKMLYRLYQEPRPIIKENDKLRVRNEAHEIFSKIHSALDFGVSFGYDYEIPLNTHNEKTTVSLGAMEKNGDLIKPAFVFPTESAVDGLYTMEYPEVYPGVILKVKDIQEYRYKEFILNNVPENIISGQDIIFWEEYTLPFGARVTDQDGNLIVDKKEMVSKEIRVKLPDESGFSVTGAMITDDSHAYERSFDLSQIVEIKDGKMRVGIKVSTDYLLNPETKYPVVIDPTVCANPSGCLSDLYLQYLTGRDTTSQYLLMGYFYSNYTSGACAPKGHASRHTVTKFNLSSITSGSQVTSAFLELNYDHRGSCTSYTGSKLMAVKQINTNWTTSDITYNKVRGGLTSAGDTIYVGDNSCYFNQCQWTVNNSVVQNWVNGSTVNNGLLIEPQENWPSGGTPPSSWTTNQALYFFRSQRYSGGAYAPALYVEAAVKKADLIDGGYNTMTKNTYVPGETMSYSIGTKNIGNGTSNSGNIAYYINPSSNCNNTSNSIGNKSYGALSQNGSASQSFFYGLPSSMAAGQYCLHVVIDSNNQTSESDESNNVVNISFTVNSAPKPDLVRTSDSLNKYNFIPGETVSPWVGVKNQGTAGAGSTYVNFYLTQNSCGYSNQIGQTYLSSLGSNNQTSINHNYNIPSNITLGTYYLSYHIDGSNSVSESNESNNQYCFGAITISGKPDFTPSSFSITDTKLRYSGLNNTITVNGRIRNLGNVGNSSVGYMLRLKSLTDSLTYNLTSISPSTLNLSAGYDQYINLTGTVPSNMPYYANYTVEIILDSSAAIAESNENNNIIASSNYVAVQQYYTGGGGGSGSSADADSDTFTNVEETFVGTNVNGSQSLSPFDTSNKQKTAILADKPKNRIAASTPISYSDAMASINTAFIVGSPSYGADPVNIRTGAFEFNQTDFALSGRGLPINFNRVYNSKISDNDSRLGNGWSDSYNIFYYQDPTTKNILLYLGGSLTTLYTTSDGGVTFNAPHGEFEILTKESGNLVYKTLNGIKYIFSLQLTNNLGILKQIVDTKGNTVTLNYNTVRDIPLISSIVDASGRQISFVYPVNTDPLWDKIQEVRESVGGTSKLIAKYTYDSNENLITDHQESNYSVEVTKNIDRTFTYDISGRMLTYTDSRSTTLYNDYDLTGRIKKQWETKKFESPVDKRLVFELMYTDSTDVNVAGSAHCTLVKNYRDASNHYDEYACYNSNELKIYSKKGNNIEQWQYDGNGMIIKYTDALGNIINYTYDAKRRLISQTQSDITDWRTVTTFDYENNFNRLIKKTETVTALTGKTLPAPKVVNYTIDPTNGNLTAVQYPDGTSESFQYDGFGNIKKHTNKNNIVTDYVYDTNGNYLTSETVSVTQADNSTQIIKKQYGYNAYGHRTSYIDPNGKSYGYGYDTRGNLRIETDPLSNSRYYKYDQEDHKISEIDALGHEVQYVYDTDISASLLSVTKVSGSGNIVNSRQYDYVGNLVKEIDGNGNNKTYAYTAENWLLNTADAKSTITNEYYSNGWLKKQTDSEGRRTDYFYDSRGNKTETRAYYDATNFISNKFVYDGFNRVISQTDGKNNVTTFAYDVLDRIITSTDANGGVTTYFYDAVGNKIGERSPRASADATLRNTYGYSTAYFYDNANRLIKKVNADNKATLYIYDANGNVLKSTENQNSDGTSAAHVSQATYFDNNWKKTETDANGGVVQYTYEKVGTVKTKTTAAGLVNTYTYDDFNRLTKETDNAGLATNYQYDANSNKTAVTYPDTTKTQYTYNALNQILTVKDALNGTRQFEYDGANNKTKEINKLGKATNFVYDKLNRLSQEINPAGTATNYIYDNNSNRTAETVGAKTTAYEYDELNRNTKITYPGNKSESVTYDINGNIATKTDGKGQKITYTSDKLNRLASKLLPGGFTVQYVYDNWNNLTNLTDESGTTQYVYDNLNRNTTETKTFVGLAGKNYTIVRAYNADSQLSALTDGASRKFDYVYNTRGLLDNVKLGATTLAKYTYSNFGKPNLVEYGNGTKTNLMYDGLNRVTNIATNSGTTTLFSQTYTYNAQSNRTAMVEDKNSTTTYSYDDLEQLTNLNINNSGNASVLGYTYDIYGNRTTATNPLSSANYTYTASTNELDKVVYNNRLSVASLFDSNGSLSKETFTKLGKIDKEIVYTWDNQNRLSQINYQYTNRPAFMPAVPDNTLNFTYDDFNNRTKKQATNGTLTYYINSGNTVLNEINSTGTTTKSMVYGLSTIAEIDQNNVVTYIHQDTLGSTVLTTNQAGGTVTKYQYDPFGQIIGQDGFTNTNYLYTNQEYDQESELYYYNARYYNPRLGRFISRDPYLGRDGDTISRNGYTYVKNNPLKYVDPSGETEEQSIYDKVVNNGFVQGTGGFFVGAGQGLWSTVKTVGNVIAHPIDTAVGIGQSVKNTAVGTYELGMDFYNAPGKTWNETTTGLGMMYDEFVDRSPYEVGKSIGFGTEKIAEAILLTKGAGAVNKIIKNAGVTSEVGENALMLEMRQNSVGLKFKQNIPGFSQSGQKVKDVINGLKNGSIQPSELPINYANIDGHNVILNNKSFSAIKGAGVNPVLNNVSSLEWAQSFGKDLLNRSSGNIFDFLNIYK